MATPLPHPEPAQIKAVQQALIRHTNDARRALKRLTNGAADNGDYAAAMGEVRACQSWLDTYVTHRKGRRMSDALLDQHDRDVTRVDGYITLTADQRWGWGVTIADAVAAAKRAGATVTRKSTRLTVRLPQGALDAYVDQMGQVRWTWAEDAPDRADHGDLVEIPA